ncbi:hypothetical protein A1359_07110 [Methylomonas lenta]|uniref:Uncharacterized protein n=1 Tax=Methylomonas lenta TaxID=980561 RepID=A0A177NGH1_9GAMM|nr:hypothetical protein A1359_07110 [Methylomonas lenta]
MRLLFPCSGVTAIKLRKNNPFSLREKVRMRGLNKAFLPYYKSPLPNPLQQERELFLNLMALMLRRGNTVISRVGWARFLCSRGIKVSALYWWAEKRCPPYAVCNKLIVKKGSARMPNSPVIHLFIIACFAN